MFDQVKVDLVKCKIKWLDMMEALKNKRLPILLHTIN